MKCLYKIIIIAGLLGFVGMQVYAMCAPDVQPTQSLGSQAVRIYQEGTITFYESDGKIVACGPLQQYAGYIEYAGSAIARLDVNLSFRLQGLGRRLIDKALVKIAARQPDAKYPLKVRLEAYSIGDNTISLDALLRFYKRCGAVEEEPCSSDCSRKMVFYVNRDGSKIIRSSLIEQVADHVIAHGHVYGSLIVVGLCYALWRKTPRELAFLAGLI